MGELEVAAHNLAKAVAQSTKQCIDLSGQVRVLQVDHADYMNDLQSRLSSIHDEQVQAKASHQSLREEFDHMRRWLAQRPASSPGSPANLLDLNQGAAAGQQ